MKTRTYRGVQTDTRYTVRQTGAGNAMETVIRNERDGEQITVVGEWELGEMAVLLAMLAPDSDMSVEVVDGP